MMHYNSEQLSSFPWIVSCDTLRTKDLLPQYWCALETAAALAGVPFPLTSDELWQLKRLVGKDSSEADWSDSVAYDLLETLTDRLQDFAPSGFYFGANEGDGACRGFWLTEEWAQALETLGLGDNDPSGWAELIAELDADGIDPDTIDDAYQGRAEGYNEERAGADYAQQLAEDTGDINWSKLRWPLTCIDWEAAWAELQTGDGYRLHDLGGGEWLVFRSV